MTEPEALKVIEEMSTQEFNHFLKGLPERTRFDVRAGRVEWREVLPELYIKQQDENK